MKISKPRIEPDGSIIFDVLHSDLALEKPAYILQKLNMPKGLEVIAKANDSYPYPALIPERTL